MREWSISIQIQHTHVKTREDQRGGVGSQRKGGVTSLHTSANARGQQVIATPQVRRNVLHARDPT